MFIDILIVLFVISSTLRGREIGLVRQVCSTVGFVGGLFLGAWLQPYIINRADSMESRALLAAMTTLGCAIILLAVAEAVGMVLKKKLQGKILNKPDAILGSIAGGLTLLLLIWLSAPILQAMPVPSIKRAINSSTIISKLNSTLPSAPNAISQIGRLVYPNGFPQVFIGLEPTPADAPLPELGELRPAVEKSRASVVKIEGRGCGGIVDGSGFVAASGFVATNAHVVAGLERPYVTDANGAHPATVVWFDKDLDLAVLRVDNLAGQPLPLDTAIQPTGTPSVIMGYPGGGGFQVNPASVMDQFTATGRDIYDQARTSREVYSVKGSVVQGNSGGPLIDKEGEVIGVIFATSTSYDQVGYALTMEKVATEINQAVQQNRPKSTGQCAA
jgi:S1-C subfamily serine protease